MGIAIWCDVKDKGHAFDEREAIIVKVGDHLRYFCQAHCIPAFVTAFHTARIAGESSIFLPTLGGQFTVVPDTSQPTPDQQPDHGQRRDASPNVGKPKNRVPGEEASQRTAVGKGRPDDRSREAGQAIADLLEQESRKSNGEPAAANYGGRA